MRYYTRNFILTTVGILAILLLCPAMHANTAILLTLNGAGTSYSYNVGGTTYTENVGPYTATLNGTPNTLIFCLDLNKTTTVGTTYSGSLSSVSILAASGQDATLTEHEEEAAFLASYALTQQNPNLYGPIQGAIWYVMQTMGGIPEDPAAVQYVTMSQDAYNHRNGLSIPPSLLNVTDIYFPTDTGRQRFITVTPEPGTMVFMGTGVLLLALSRIRRKR